MVVNSSRRAVGFLLHPHETSKPTEIGFGGRVVRVVFHAHFRVQKGNGKRLVIAYGPSRQAVALVRYPFRHLIAGSL